MEEYSMDETPLYNPALFDNHGIRNDTSLDGKDIVLPRFGFTYEQGDMGMMKDVTIRGGLGYFTGGRPNVWMGGTFSNDGIGIQNASVPLSAAANFNGFDTTPFDSYIYQPGQPGFRPAYADMLDPNFELPKDMKMSIGMDWELGDGWYFSADYLKTETDTDLHFKQLRLGNPAFAGSVDCPEIGNSVSNMPIGTAVDGRLIYADYSYCGKAMEKFYDGRGYDMLLTNTDKGHSDLVSLSMAKAWDSWDIYASYTWQDVQTVGNLSSSRNISNFKYTTKYANFNEDVLHRSIYSREHTFNFVANYTKYFFDNHPTTFTFVGAAISGEPFSYTFGNYKDGALWGLDKESTRDATAAFYVPNGDVVVPSYFQSDLDSYIAAAGLSGYAGGFAPINGFETDWNYRLDFKLTQEFPGLGLTDNDKFVLTLDVENLLNLIDSEYGRQTKASSSDRSIAEAVPVSLGDGNFTYEYKPAYRMSLDKIHNESTNYYRSLYRIQLGFKYQF
jgi:hypothetical protein